MTFEDFQAYGLNVSRETFLRFEKYVQSLLEWNQRINLIGRNSEDQIWQRHILDSLQLQKYLQDPKARIADLGSGAGLPGAVLAMAGYTQVTLIEKNVKKAAFLRYVSRETSTAFQVIENDIQNVQMKFDILTSRGLTGLSDLLEMTLPLLKKNGMCLFLKGEQVEDEIFMANLHHWKMTMDRKQSITNPRASLLIITNIEKAQEKDAQSRQHSSRKSKRGGW